MSFRIPNPLAERRYMTIGTGRTVTLTIGPPHPDPNPSGDWQCAVEILGLDQDFFELAHGLDALGAIINAIGGARHRLVESGLDVNWLGGLDIGIPRYVPDFGDRELTRSIERYIDERLEAYVAEHKARHAAREQPEE